MLCKFWAQQTTFCFSCELKFSLELARGCCRPKQRPSLRSIFRSAIGLGVKIWHRNKTGCSKLIPIQCSRSKSMTYPRKGPLLRLESNSTVTSDGGAQKLRNDIWHDSESIPTKVCSRIGRKWNAVFESHVVTSFYRTSFDFQFEDFWAICCLFAFVKSYLMCYWPTIHNLILKMCPKFSKSQSSLFQIQWAVWWALSKNCAKWNFSTPMSPIYVKSLRSRILIARNDDCVLFFQINTNLCLCG